MYLIILFIPLPIITADEPSDDVIFLTDDDFERGKALPEMPDGPVNVSSLYSDDLIQGDILSMPTETGEEEGSGEGVREKRNIIRWRPGRWPGGVVPYDLTKGFNENEPKLITDKDYITFTRLTTDSCSSHVGKIGGAQPLNLGNGCFHKGVIMHELMHALGFVHEQSRPDRDNHVVVFTANVEAGHEGNFIKYSGSYVNMIGRYDYGSLMHYGMYDFGKPFTGFDRWWYGDHMMTIKPRKAGVSIGQKVGLSSGDKHKLRKIYNCTPIDPKTTTTMATTANPPSDCEDILINECLLVDPAKCSPWQGALCPKTCGLCGVCADTFDRCQQVKEKGLCNWQRAADVCTKTCGYCPGSLEECYDEAVQGCGDVMENGLCTLPTTRMGCARSCGLCRGCHDTAADGCDKVKDDGKCDNLTIRHSCQKTCGFCTECSDKAKEGCEGMVQVGLCNRPEAEQNCRKSCGYCEKNSKEFCTKHYVKSNGVPEEACKEKRVSNICPDLCDELPADPPTTQ